MDSNGTQASSLQREALYMLHQPVCGEKFSRKIETDQSLKSIEYPALDAAIAFSLVEQLTPVIVGPGLQPGGGTTLNSQPGIAWLFHEFLGHS